MKASAHSLPAPKTAAAKRFEYVRTHQGFQSLRSFWEALRDAGSRYSYEAVRNYHYDREAPVGYLKDIRRVFPQFSISYLAGESETPTEQHAQTNIAASMASSNSASTFAENSQVIERARTEQRTAEAYALSKRVATHRMWYEIREAMGAGDGGGIDITHWESPHAHIPYWVAPLADIRRRVWGRYMLIAAPTAMHEDDFRAERWIGNALGGPLKAFGVNPKSMEYWQLGEYILNMLPSLNWLVEAADADAVKVVMEGTHVRLADDAPLFDYSEIRDRKSAMKADSVKNQSTARKTSRRK